MPRYYFHLHSPGSGLKDEEGVVLPDNEAAWYQAVRSARELIRGDLHLGCSWEDQEIQIEDAEGLPLNHIPLRDIASYAI
jgi:hypothetical protein